MKVKRKYVIMDALLCIYKLKLKLEAIKTELANLIAVKREYLSLMKELQLPKVNSPPSLSVVISFLTFFFLLEKMKHSTFYDTLSIYFQKEVEVEKGEKGFIVRVTCEKGGDKLVSILEVFEEMGLTVSHARVSCNLYLSMEAIVVAEEERALHAKSIAQAVTKAIERQ
jgi:hypothetical protein